MQAQDVLELVQWLDRAGIPIWLDGGWGVDALLGRQTRPHADLDVVMAREHLTHAQAVLGAHGFVLDVGRPRASSCATLASAAWMSIS